MSWVHEHDFCAAIEFLINHEELSGPVNICSPNLFNGSSWPSYASR